MGTVDKKDTNQAELAKMMVGREVFLNIEKAGPYRRYCAEN